MTGRQMNIYLQETNYSFLKSNVSERKISKWINEAIHEKIVSNEKSEMNDLVNGYIAMSKDKDLSKMSSNLLDESLRKIYE